MGFRPLSLAGKAMILILIAITNPKMTHKCKKRRFVELLPNSKPSVHIQVEKKLSSRIAIVK